MPTALYYAVFFLHVVARITSVCQKKHIISIARGGGGHEACGLQGCKWLYTGHQLSEINQKVQ